MTSRQSRNEESVGHARRASSTFGTTRMLRVPYGIRRQEATATVESDKQAEAVKRVIASSEDRLPSNKVRARREGRMDCA